jgi:hypothetical protein
VGTAVILLKRKGVSAPGHATMPAFGKAGINRNEK